MVQLLIVDDDEDDRDIFCEAVHEIAPAINCIVARSGQEALAGLRLHNLPTPNIIFLDLYMPGLNGFQCLREIKKDNAWQAIPVVIYTTSKLKEDQTEADALGAHFLTKPTSFKELCLSIESIFKKEMISLK